MRLGVNFPSQNAKNRFLEIRIRGVHAQKIRHIAHMDQSWTCRGRSRVERRADDCRVLPRCGVCETRRIGNASIHDGRTRGTPPTPTLCDGTCRPAPPSPASTLQLHRNRIRRGSGADLEPPLFGQHDSVTPYSHTSSNRAPCTVTSSRALNLTKTADVQAEFRSPW